MGFLNLTESEKLEILSLHNNAKIIGEQNGGVTPPAQAAPAQAQPAQPAQPAPAQPAPVDRTSLISQIQSILKTKYNVDLGIDGKLGPKTLQAITSIVTKRQTAPIEIAPIAKIPQLGQQTPVAQTIPVE